jgi:hypothetical protein
MGGCNFCPKPEHNLAMLLGLAPFDPIMWQNLLSNGLLLFVSKTTTQFGIPLIQRSPI